MRDLQRYQNLNLNINVEDNVVFFGLIGHATLSLEGHLKLSLQSL